MSTLRPQLQAIADRHRAVVQASHERLDNLSDAQLRWTPSDKVWSIAQIADHLVRSHTACNPVMMKALLEADFAGGEGKTTLPYSFLDRTLVKLVSPGGKIKLPVPKLFEPKVGKAPATEIVHKLQEKLDGFSLIIEKADEKKLKGLHVASPAHSMLKPSILAYLDATVQHNRYHWLQIEALLRDSKLPTS